MRLVMPGCVSDARAVPGLKIFMLLCAMAVYLCMGASVFQILEGPLERETAARVARLKIDFLNDHPCLTGHTKQITNYTEMMQSTTSIL